MFSALDPQVKLREGYYLMETQLLCTYKNNLVEFGSMIRWIEAMFLPRIFSMENILYVIAVEQIAKKMKEHCLKRKITLAVMRGDYTAYLHANDM